MKSIKIEKIQKGMSFSCNGVEYRALEDAKKADWNDDEAYVPSRITSSENQGDEVDFIGMIGESITLL